jgi:hypothetical protein
MAYNPLLQTYLNELCPLMPNQGSKEQAEGLAFLVFAVTTLLDLDLETSIQGIVDGPNDCGIDAIYLNNEEVKTLKIYFFSTKHLRPHKTFPGLDIENAISTISKICTGETLSKANPQLSAKIIEIKNIINHEKNKVPEFYLYFVSSSRETVNYESTIASAKEKDIKISFINAWDLFQILDDSEKGKDEDRNVIVTTNGPILTTRTGKTIGYVVNLSAAEVIKIYEKGGGELVFENNIRYFLGNKTINQEIIETALSKDRSQYFWYLNNGISLICNSIISKQDTSGNYRLELKNPKIINGGQTTKSLLQIGGAPTLKNVQILVRLYEIPEDGNLVSWIVRGVNNQNPIESKDLHANNKIQNIVKRYFAEKGILLESKRGEYRSKDVLYSKIVKNDTVFQAHLAIFHDSPHIAKSGKTGSFEKHFNVVFSSNNDDLSEKFFRSYEIFSFVQKMEKEHTEPKPGFLPHAQLALSYVIGRIDPTIKERKRINKPILLPLYKLSYEVIRKSVRLHGQKTRDSFSYNNLFKSGVLMEEIEEILLKPSVQKEINSVQELMKTIKDELPSDDFY